MPIVTILLSLIGVCSVAGAWPGYSINLLTLLAMVLAIGLVVDDAIVVVETSIATSTKVSPHARRSAA